MSRRSEPVVAIALFIASVIMLLIIGGVLFVTHPLTNGNYSPDQKKYKVMEEIIEIEGHEYIVVSELPSSYESVKEVTHYIDCKAEH